MREDLGSAGILFVGDEPANLRVLQSHSTIKPRRPHRHHSGRLTSEDITEFLNGLSPCRLYRLTREAERIGEELELERHPPFDPDGE